MKKSYILECYNELIREIQRPTLFMEATLEEKIQAITRESFLIYEVQFKINKAATAFEIRKPIHNLHPDAPKLNTIKLADGTFFKHAEEFASLLNLDSEILKPMATDSDDETRLFFKVDVALSSFSSDTLFYFYCFQYLSFENEHIKKCIREKSYKYRNKRHIEGFIHNQQHATGNLATNLIELINPKSIKDLNDYSERFDKTDCLKAVFDCLEKLIVFIENEYAHFLNENMHMTYRRSSVCTLMPKTDFIIEKMQASCIDQPLTKITFEPILKLEFINLNSKLTYKEFNYCSSYIDELYLWFKSDDFSNGTLSDWLYHINLNSLTFFSYKTDQIVAELSKVETIPDKLRLLYKRHKLLSQQQATQINKFRDDLPPIKNQLVNWIEEEIDYQIKKMNLDTKSINIPSENVVRSKLLSGISVAQLSYTFNLLAQVGVINQKNQRDIFRFISENFRTNTTDQISVDSIKSKYYNVETATKSAVREKIIELLNLTKL